MYRKILVTLDGTELSESVIPEVVRLARGTNTAITLLRVAKLPKREPAAEPAVIAGIGRLNGAGQAREALETVDQAMERVRLDLESYLEENAKPLRAEGLSVQCDVEFADDAAEAIDQHSRHSDADLMVMATHGRTGLARLLFGSVAGRVLERGAKPILLVQPGGA